MQSELISESLGCNPRPRQGAACPLDGAMHAFGCGADTCVKGVCLRNDHGPVARGAVLGALHPPLSATAASRKAACEFDDTRCMDRHAEHYGGSHGQQRSTGMLA